MRLIIRLATLTITALLAAACGPGAPAVDGPSGEDLAAAGAVTERHLVAAADGDWATVLTTSSTRLAGDPSTHDDQQRTLEEELPGGAFTTTALSDPIPISDPFGDAVVMLARTEVQETIGQRLPGFVAVVARRTEDLGDEADDAWRIDDRQFGGVADSLGFALDGWPEDDATIRSLADLEADGSAIREENASAQEAEELAEMVEDAGDVGFRWVESVFGPGDLDDAVELTDVLLVSELAGASAITPRVGLDFGEEGAPSMVQLGDEELPDVLDALEMTHVSGQLSEVIHVSTWVDPASWTSYQMPVVATLVRGVDDTDRVVHHLVVGNLFDGESLVFQLDAGPLVEALATQLGD